MKFNKVSVLYIALAFLPLFTILVLEFHKTRRMQRSVDLIRASRDGDLERMRNLIEEGADVDFNRSAHPNCVPLTCATKWDHIEAVELLLANNADINSTDDSCMTALMWAAEKGHTDIARLLISRGADVNAIRCSETAFTIARRYNRVEILELLAQAQR